MFVGLVHDPGLNRPEPPEAAPRRALPPLPWRLLAWVSGWVAALFAAAALGGLAGYIAILAAVAVGSWRLERWCARQHWGGLNEYHRVG
ncbi:hypothetical protein DSM104299_03097 [Baekduia alba]|uniref:hypothetical protein n=1 Tax=Baekduia alba TaxID=2997333 RepID=UPI0023422655|nr:hypothetical protein [Baekduia alba]WCB94363.1 hypothetical protein DSM104299_03097 [Baekduia alba]